MRTIIKSLSNSCVYIAYEDELGDMRERQIWAPNRGGYVKDGDRQVCERLATRGSTLHWSGGYPLIDLVRREYRRMRAAEKGR